MRSMRIRLTARWLAGLALALAFDQAHGQYTTCINEPWPDKECRYFDDQAKADAWMAEKRAAGAREASRLGDEISAIAAALMRTYYMPPTPNAEHKPPLYCLSVMGKDPPRGLVQELAAVNIRVEPRSACHVKHDPDDAVANVSFYRFQPLGRDHVRVGLSSFPDCHPFACGSDTVYLMHRDGGGTWTVENIVTKAMY
jgi:hypothetical protein